MAEDLSVQGVVTEIGIKDGVSDKGAWRKWSFNVQGHEDGRKHWYGWFNDKGSEIKTGVSYNLTYTTSENKQNSDHPYRNVQTMQEIDTSTTAAPEERTTSDRRGNDIFRTKEELRWTEAMRMAVVYVAAYDASSEPLADIHLMTGQLYQMLEAAPGAVLEQGRPPAPRQSSNPQESSDVATTITVEDAIKLMDMADDLMEKDGRKWVMGEIKTRWGLTQPGQLSPDQMKIIVDVLNGGDGEPQAVERFEAEISELFDEAEGT